ncbi:hypothetical protein A9Q99_26975 [Gammaproteobacteria bacterium 45_16_T64]|nr:hypothetical protein A9Q99_26975 [Gammaproteobacteria bacterium 45_16_T64]
MHPTYDVFIIGGGINGATIACKLSAKGMTIALCDEKDLSGESTSHNNKLFQCGFNHLENLDLTHVSNANKTRDILYQQIPHLMQPVDIVIPDAPSIRSSLKMKAGTLLYGWLRNSQTSPKPHTQDIDNSHYSSPLASSPTQATLCQEFLLDDARLVVEYLLAAEKQHCQLLPQTKVTSGIRKNGVWHISLVDAIDGTETTVTARCIINATGAQAYSVLEKILGSATRCSQPLEKQSYIVLPKFYEGDHGYMIQLPCKHFLNVLPHLANYCVVGPFTQATCLEKLSLVPNSEETRALLDLTNLHFHVNFTEQDICHAYATSRAITFDPNQPIHMLDLQCEDGQSPILSIFSSHLTTHRTLADQILECIQPYLPSLNQTASCYQLPGGDFSPDGFSSFINRLAELYPWMPCKLMTRYCKLYGARTQELLSNKHDLNSLGQEIFPDLYEAEVYWLIEHEWATCAEDILLRRTKLFLTVNKNNIDTLNQWFTCNYKHQSKISQFPDILANQCKAS